MAKVWRIKPARLAAWAARFPNARVLTVSNTGFNIFAPMPAELSFEIAGAVAGLRRLESLSLRTCEIGDDGACALAAALLHVPGLKQLDVSRNGIGAVGSGALAAALPHVPGLEKLNMGRDNIFDSIGNDGEAALRAAAAGACPGLALSL